MNIETNTSARSGTGNGIKELFKKNGIKELFKKIDTPENWKTKSFMLVCAVALAIDPLFLFIPEIDYENSCISFDQKLRRAVGNLRNFIDGGCAIAILVIPRISLRGEMSTGIRRFYLVIDILSAVPIHVALPNHFFRYEGSYFLVSKRALKWTMAGQYIPRIIRIYPSYKAVTKTTVTIAESKWIGALLNLLLFLLCSYLFGAFWYVTAIEKQSICWQDFWEQTRITSGIPKTGGDVNNTVLVEAFGNDTRWIKTRINLSELYCANLDTGNNLFLGKSCPINIIDPDDAKKQKTLLEIKSNTQYDFGMYSDVLNYAVASKGLRDFPKKFFYCFWWGLRNLSTFGQGLMPGNSATDILLAIVICACGLFLVAVLIGNVQKYLLTSTVRSDEMKERKKDTEAWMTYRKLPEDLKKRIKENEKTIWKNVRGTDEESLLRRLPEELRRETQPYLLDD